MRARGSRFSLLLTLSLLWVAAPAAVHAFESELNLCNTQNFPFVFVGMRVTEGGAPVLDLTRDNFQCIENGDLQTELFDVTPPDQSGGVRLADIVFLIDTSGSMGGEIAEVRTNVKTFADDLVTNNVDFRLGIVQFGQTSGRGNPVCKNGGNLTDDVPLFESLVDMLFAGGSIEPGFLALREALGCFNFRPGAQKHFILITDEDADDPRQIILTIDLLVANDVQVHTHVDCLFGTSNPDYCDDTSVRGVTNGLLSAVTDPLDDVLQRILDDISSTYLLRYRSSNPAFDGTAREAECTVSNGSAPASVTCSYVPGEAPLIELTPETEALRATAIAEGTTPVLSAFVTYALPPLIQSVTLSFRTTGAASYQEIAMVPVGGDRYEVTLPPVATPGVDFFITATDGVLTSALPSADPSDFPFQIGVLPNVAPEIVHTPVPVAARGAPIGLSAQVVDNTNQLAGAELRWRRIGELLYNSIAMGSIGGDQFLATIPSSEVTNGIEYFLRAEDDLGVASTHGTPDDPHLIGLICAGARIPEQITDFGSCGPLGMKTPIWGRFQSRAALVADSGERLELECADLGGGQAGFRLLYTRPGGSPLRVGVSPFQSACNSAYFFHAGDSDNNGQPDCLLGSNWVSRDYGANDQFNSTDPPCIAGVNPWTGTCEENENFLDHAISIFDANSNNLTKIDRKHDYATPPPLPAGTCSDPSAHPEGMRISDIVVDPQLGPETEAFFEEAEAALQNVPFDGPMEESPDPLCDYDGDGDCDLDDLDLLLQDLGKSVADSQCGAPCDLDGDGTITDMDASEFRPLCTNPSECASTEIDIKPRKFPNRIKFPAKKKDKITVGILSTPEFDAAAVMDRGSLTFGATGDENSLRRKGRHDRPDCREKDVDKDGLRDLKCRFLARQTGFVLGDVEGVLRGQTLDGTPIEGRDSVLIVERKVKRK